MKTIKPHKSLIQFAKYAAVGVMNTALTMLVIFTCKSLLGVNPYVSNALGYVVGLINSFIWNRRWVFRSNGRLSHEAVHFLAAFAVSYAVQFGVVWVITQIVLAGDMWVICGFTLSGYGVATLIGNVAYTVTNFVYNRMLTFRAGVS